MTGPIIRLPAVMSLTGLSKSAIYDRMDKNSPRHVKDFPKCFSLDGGAVGWFLSDLEKWQQGLAAKGRQGSPSKKAPAIGRQALSPDASAEPKGQPQKAGQKGSGTSKANVPLPTHQGSKPRNLADTIVQGGQVNDRLRYFLELKTWTPAMGALLISGIDAPQGCDAIPNQGVGLDGKPLHPGDSRFADAHRVLREWRDWQEDAGDQSSEMEPVRFLNWCLRDEINTEWLSLFLELLGFSDGKSVDLTASRFALLTGK